MRIRRTPFNILVRHQIHTLFSTRGLSLQVYSRYTLETLLYKYDHAWFIYPVRPIAIIVEKEGNPLGVVVGTDRRVVHKGTYSNQNRFEAIMSPRKSIVRESSNPFVADEPQEFGLEVR